MKILAISTVFSICAFALSGCMKPNPLLDELADTDETGDSGAEGDADEGDADEGDADEGDVPLDLPEGEANSCAPPEAFEPGCDSCLAGSCCEIAYACAEAPGCACLANCMLAGGNAGSCKNECDGVKAADLPALEPLLACADEACAASC